MKTIDYTYMLTVRDAPSVLLRVAQVFSRRGCNIRSLQVQPSTSNQWSTMTIAVNGAGRADQIQQQLEKLVDVARVSVHEHIVED